MKILTISDVVVNSLYSPGAKQRFSDIELVLSCGDLPAYYLEFIVSILDVPLYYVIGNHADEHHSQSHDTAWRPEQKRAWDEPSRFGDGARPADEESVGPRGCVNIDGRTVNHKGLLIAGLQGSMWYNGGPYQYTEVLMLTPYLLLNRLRYGRALDIMITHAPPAGIHDDVDLAHRGFRCFLQFMDDFAPRYLIHGHKHVYLHGETTVTQYNRTTVINTYGFRRLELEVAAP